MPDLAEKLFLALFAFYLLETLWAQWRGTPGEAAKLSLFRVLLQLPLFGLGVYLAVRWGALDRRLFSLVEIVPALIAGHLIFGASVLATHRSWSDTRSVLADWESLRDFFVMNPNVVFRTIQLSFTEEVIYRAALQGLLVLWFGPLPGVLLGAALFTLSHEHVYRNSRRETIEFIVFSLLLGGIYYATSSLAAVVAIHAVRNFEIASLEFAVRAHDSNEETAQRELDQRYRQESPASP